MGRDLRRGRRKRTQKTTILLATNGGKTEKTYLGMLKDRVPRDSGLSIKTSWHDGKEPKTILKALQHGSQAVPRRMPQDHTVQGYRRRLRALF